MPVVHAANLRLNIEGLEGQLNQNVRVQLSNISQDEVVPNGRFRARVEKAIKEGLKPLGYYQPTVEFSYEEKNPACSFRFNRQGHSWRTYFIEGSDC